MDKIIKELNENSNLKYKLGIKQPKTFKGDYKKINNYMSVDIYEPSKNYERFLSFYSYPTDEDKHILASYSILNENENVFGIKINSKLDDATKILQNFGYQQENKNTFKKDNLTIEFELKNKTICQINVKLQSKYLGNRLY